MKAFAITNVDGCKETVLVYVKDNENIIDACRKYAFASLKKAYKDFIDDLIADGATEPLPTWESFVEGEALILADFARGGAVAEVTKVIGG